MSATLGTCHSSPNSSSTLGDQKYEDFGILYGHSPVDEETSVGLSHAHIEFVHGQRAPLSTTSPLAHSWPLRKSSMPLFPKAVKVPSHALQSVILHAPATTKSSHDSIVDFEGPGDKLHPLNWPFRKKCYTTLLYGFIAMGATISSSIYSPAISDISHTFSVSQEVSTLGITLLLLGFGVGPLLWAPLSELYGRIPAVLIPTFFAAIFAFAGGAASNIQTILICRFFQGFFGSSPIGNTGGVLGDIWSAEQRGGAITSFAMAVVGGATLGPIIGGAICISRLGWRWTQYVTGAFQISMLILCYLVLDESYPATLLVNKARRLRRSTGNWALHAKHEEYDGSLNELTHKYLVRPFQLLGTPICLLMSLYASFVYGILYGSLAAFPIEFEKIRGWNKLIGALPFLATLLGMALGAGANLLNQKFYLKRWKANNRRPVPEARLPPMMFGSVIYAVGLFIFAWTSAPNVTWVAPCVGITLMGMGFFTIFQAALNYLIDTFQRHAASAVAANMFLRSIFAALFPLFVTPMLHALGFGWGISVFAFIACLLVPLPVFFYIYGKRIRASGLWSRESVE